MDIDALAGFIDELNHSSCSDRCHTLLMELGS